MRSLCDRLRVNILGDSIGQAVLRFHGIRWAVLLAKVVQQLNIFLIEYHLNKDENIKYCIVLALN